MGSEIRFKVYRQCSFKCYILFACLVKCGLSISATAIDPATETTLQTNSLVSEDTGNKSVLIPQPAEFHEAVTLPPENKPLEDEIRRNSRVKENSAEESSTVSAVIATTDENEFFKTLNSNVSPKFRPQGVLLRRRDKVTPHAIAQVKVVEINVSEPKNISAPSAPVTVSTTTTEKVEFQKGEKSNRTSFAEEAVSLIFSYLFDVKNKTDPDNSTDYYVNATDLQDEFGEGESRTLASLFFRNWRKSLTTTTTTESPALESKLGIGPIFSPHFLPPSAFRIPPIPPPPMPLLPPPLPPPRSTRPSPSVPKPPNTIFTSKPFVGDPGIEYVFKNLDELQRPGIPISDKERDVFVSADTVGFSPKAPESHFGAASERLQPLKVMRHPLRSEKDVPRCDRFTEDVCLDDFEYPGAAILEEIFMKRKLFDDMYVEVMDRGEQVEGIPRRTEESYNYVHYFGRGRPETLHQDGYFIEPRDYHEEGGYICPSEVVYGRPKRARNAKGEWKVVINVEQYTQTVRMERCLRRNSPCSYLLHGVYSKCSQMYSYHRFLVFEKGRNFHMDIFKIPTGCSCHVKTGRRQVPPPSLRGNVVHSHSPSGSILHHSRHRPRYPPSSGTGGGGKMTFSEVLWSILSDPNSEITLAQNPQVLSKLRSHVMAIQQLKQMSPSEVLHELLEEEADYGDLMTSVSDRPVTTVKHNSADLPVYKDKDKDQHAEHKLQDQDKEKMATREKNRTPAPTERTTTMTSMPGESPTSPPSRRRRPLEKRPVSRNPGIVGSRPILPPAFPPKQEYSVLVTDMDDVSTFQPIRKRPPGGTRYQSISLIADSEVPEEISIIELPPRIKLQETSFTIPRPQSTTPKNRINFSYHPILEYIKPGDEIIINTD